MSGLVTHTTYNCRENTIIHESNPLTTFYNVTSRLPGHNFRPFFSAVPCFGVWFLLARLVEEEIVSPYCGIFINTSVGNPTVPRERFLRNRQVFRLRRKRSIPIAFIKEPRVVSVHAKPLLSLSILKF